MVGTVLNQGKYDSFKSGFSGIALRNGYFDGEFKKVSLVFRLSGMKRSGISTMTAGSVTGLVMSALQAHRSVKSICASWFLITKATTTVPGT